jgi:predicted RNA-binding Zn ribbon-like protein
VAILNHVDPLDRLRYASRRMTDPFEALAQRVAEQVLDLIVSALDVNALLDRVDVNALVGRVEVNALLDRVDVSALLERADVNELLERVDVGALLDRVDVNDLVRRVDMDTLVEQTDLGAVIARSSGGAASEALDAARSQAVGLDQFIDRWVQRGLRRKHPAPAGPPDLLDGRAGP